MILNFIQAHGLAGIVSILLVVLALYNILMSAIAQGFLALHKQEPQWMQTAGAYGVKAAQWLSANVPITTPAQAQAQIESAAPAQTTTPPSS